jgi:hypothetical protein
VSVGFVPLNVYPFMLIVTVRGGPAGGPEQPADADRTARNAASTAPRRRGFAMTNSVI